MSVNQTARDLKPYPMEELTRIRQGLVKKGMEVFDFGTGDPKIPTWQPIRDAIRNAVPEVSQYPSVRGTPDVVQAISGYMQRRFDVAPSKDIGILPTNGSKEAIFSIALSLIGRGGKKVMIYPDPGYPVYETSALFAGGVPHPVRLERSNNYLLEPWNLPLDVQKNTAVLWINHPHNPTGAMAPRTYYEDVIRWCEKYDVVLLSDDCYVDIYDIKYDRAFEKNPKQDERPLNPLSLAHRNVISFMSLSKRSGMTGYRSGAIVGDAELLKDIERSRSSFGCATPTFILAGAKVAWDDDQHVAIRRAAFTERIDAAFPKLQSMGLIDDRPDAAFYLWCRIPPRWGQDDVRFALDVATIGVICQPSQWLSEGLKGHVRFALVPETVDTLKAFDLLKDYIAKHA